MFFRPCKKQKATSPDVAYVLTVERSFTLEVRIAVFTAMSYSWLFIKQNGYFISACGAFTPKIRKSCKY
jgi:hypothetical protein